MQYQSISSGIFNPYFSASIRANGLISNTALFFPPDASTLQKPSALTAFAALTYILISLPVGIYFSPLDSLASPAQLTIP